MWSGRRRQGRGRRRRDARRRAGERSRLGAGLAAQLTSSVVLCGDAAAPDARGREPLAPPFFASSSGRRRGGSSRGALSDGRSPCISVACIAVRTARCAVASLALLDHVLATPRTGLQPVGFRSIGGGEGSNPLGLRSPVFETGVTDHGLSLGGGAGGGRSILRARRLARLATGAVADYWLAAPSYASGPLVGGLCRRTR